MGELGAGDTARQTAFDPPARQLADWEAHQTVWHATDLLSAAVVSSHSEMALDAARFLLTRRDRVSVAALELARSVLEPQKKASIDEFAEDWHTTIRTVRAATRENPRSAIQWTDLALAHTVVGNRKAAFRAIGVALALAPENRFILRSAARCYLHWREPDRAHTLIKGSARTLHDPWLLSTEIALASARGRKSANVAEARRMVNGGSFSPFSTSELASGLGSMEIETGDRRNAGPLLARALESPTENSVAQIEWLLNKMNRPLDGFEAVNVPKLYEARAVESFVKGDWSQALQHARLWLQDQPFSSRPADLASYAASLLGNYEDAVTLLREARVSNPDEQMILNNLAYFSVLAGNLEDGAAWLSLVDWSELAENETPIFTATKGLIHFRNGEIDKGREAYEFAIREGVRLKIPRLETIALMNLSREERLGGDPVLASQRLDEARIASKRTQELDIQTMFRQFHLG